MERILWVIVIPVLFFFAGGLAGFGVGWEMHRYQTGISDKLYKADYVPLMEYLKMKRERDVCLRVCEDKTFVSSNRLSN